MERGSRDETTATPPSSVANTMAGFLGVGMAEHVLDIIPPRASEPVRARHGRFAEDQTVAGLGDDVVVGPDLRPESAQILRRPSPLAGHSSRTRAHARSRPTRKIGNRRAAAIAEELGSQTGTHSVVKGFARFSRKFAKVTTKMAGRLVSIRLPLTDTATSRTYQSGRNAQPPSCPHTGSCW